jgi:hypothetical protein
MNRWMKRRIERSRARCERATNQPQINTESTDKKAAAAAPLLSSDKKQRMLITNNQTFCFALIIEYQPLKLWLHTKVQ